MISIIICSRTAVLSEELLANISTSIGVPYELVMINNAANQHSICQAYNMGLQQSKYTILCFMHDDLKYLSQHWGHKVSAHFANTGANALGVAGTPYLSFMPGPWWGSNHTYQYLAKPGANTLPEAAGTGMQQVVLIDGCWMCIKKEVFDTIRFDETTFSGYHFYDVDICIQMTQAGYKIYAVADVAISHSSLGNVNRRWIADALTFHNKWQKVLPVACKPIETVPVFGYEYKTLNAFLWACYTNNYTNKYMYSLALKSQLRFKKGFAYYKAPAYVIKFLFKYLFKKGKPFYSFL